MYTCTHTHRHKRDECSLGWRPAWELLCLLSWKVINYRRLIMGTRHSRARAPRRNWCICKGSRSRALAWRAEWEIEIVRIWGWGYGCRWGPTTSSNEMSRANFSFLAELVCLVFSCSPEREAVKWIVDAELIVRRCGLMMIGSDTDFIILTILVRLGGASIINFSRLLKETNRRYLPMLFSDN